jgi:hypothetical protein
MNPRAGWDRSQTRLFPERLEDYIAAENPVRFLDAFVHSLDLHALGFARAWVCRYGPAALCSGGAAQAFPPRLSASRPLVPDAGDHRTLGGNVKRACVLRVKQRFL